jgi:hypothetical protein
LFVKFLKGYSYPAPHTINGFQFFVVVVVTVQEKYSFSEGYRTLEYYLRRTLGIKTNLCTTAV